jgi:signal transduction histidine kinase
MFTNDIGLTVVVFTLVIFIMILGVVLTMIVANRRHVQQEVKMAQMQLSYEKELRTVENEVQEQVLTNVARELHDNIGQLLTLMRIQIEQEKLDRSDLATVLAPVDSTLTDTIQQVRLLSRSLNTDILEQGGLLNSIDTEVSRLSSFKNVQVHWENDEVEPLLSKDQKIMAFRIFQEITNNILKHAKARNIHIGFTGKQPFALSIKDDGQGFDLQQTLTSGRSSGLKNMSKRAELAHLIFNIDTAPGRGSIFTLTSATKS